MTAINAANLLREGAHPGPEEDPVQDEWEQRREVCHRCLDVPLDVPLGSG